MSRQGRMEKEDKALGIERCENINTVYIKESLKSLFFTATPPSLIYNYIRILWFY